MNDTASPLDPLAFFTTFLQAKGLRNTPQRNRIVEVFLQQKGHLTIEELYNLVRHEDPSVGQTTIYRTIKLLCEAGLAYELHFDGVDRYEHATKHHDHLICERCGKNIEVVDSDIERLQIGLAKKHGFAPTSHRLYLYGICPDCLKREKESQQSSEII